MVKHTVGLIGSNGNVGRPTLLHLLEHVDRGTITLVVFHRPGRKPQDLPAHIETRELDLEHTNVEELTRLVGGLHVLISTITPTASGQSNADLADALAKTDGFVTFIPALYTSQWTERDRQDETLGPLLGQFSAGVNHAKEIGVGTTIVSTGLFDSWAFGLGFLGASIKTNELVLDDGQRKHGLAITLMDHLGKVLADTAASDPASIKNTTRSVVTYQPTGEELIELFTKINSSKPTIKPWGKAEIAEANKNVEALGPLRVGYARHWTEGTFPPLQKVTDNKHAAAPSLEELIRQFA